MFKVFPCIFYALSIPTELSSRGMFKVYERVLNPNVSLFIYKQKITREWKTNKQ